MVNIFVFFVSCLGTFQYLCPRNTVSNIIRRESRESAFISANLLLHPLRKGNRNQGAFILGRKAAKARCDLEAIYANLAESICGEDIPKEEVKRTLISAYQKVVLDVEKVGKPSSDNFGALRGNAAYGSPNTSKMASTMAGVKLRSLLRKPRLSSRCRKSVCDIILCANRIWTVH